MLDPIEYFSGTWRFEREVEDRIAGQAGEASGVAVFEREGGGLIWVENGELRIAESRFETTRRYSIVPDGDRWLVRFEDGRPFHYLDLSGGTDQAGHLCVADFYSGYFRVEAGVAGKQFQTRWLVTGPAKDQVISTIYRVL